MSRPKGLPKTGGRVVGSKNKIALSLKRSVAEICAANGCDPFAGLAMVTQNPAVPWPERTRAYAELCKYVKPQLKAVEHRGDPLAAPVVFQVLMAPVVQAAPAIEGTTTAIDSGERIGDARRLGAETGGKG